jgi:hypothetical protein
MAARPISVDAAASALKVLVRELAALIEANNWKLFEYHCLNLATQWLRQQEKPMEFKVNDYVRRFIRENWRRCCASMDFIIPIEFIQTTNIEIDNDKIQYLTNYVKKFLDWWMNVLVKTIIKFPIYYEVGLVHLITQQDYMKLLKDLKGKATDGTIKMYKIV